MTQDPMQKGPSKCPESEENLQFLMMAGGQKPKLKNSDGVANLRILCQLHPGHARVPKMATPTH